MSSVSKDRKCAKMAVCNFLLWLSIITFFVGKRTIYFFLSIISSYEKTGYSISRSVWDLGSKQEENIRSRKVVN